MKIFFIVLFMCLSTFIVNAEPLPTVDPAWCGNPGDTIAIRNIGHITDLIGCIKNNLTEGRTFYLSKDIDATGILFPLPVSPFNGIFDGLGRTIKGLRDPLFFALKGNDAKIQNLVLDSADVWPSNSYMGALVSIQYSGTIQNVQITNSSLTIKEGSEKVVVIGGLVGKQKGGIIKNVQIINSSLKLSGGSIIAVGGIVGHQESGIIQNIQVINSSLAIDALAIRGVGGLVGNMQGGNIYQSSFSGNISINATNTTGRLTQNIGGVVGLQQNGSIQEVKSDGLIENKKGSGQAFGGIVGMQEGGNILEARSTSQIVINKGGVEGIGGLVGVQGQLDKIVSKPQIDKSIFNGRITMWENEDGAIGGLVGIQLSGIINHSEAERNSISQDSISTSGASKMIGGGVGQQEKDGSIYSSSSSMDIILNTSNASSVGGFAGGAAGLIRGVYATGSIKGQGSNIAGLVASLRGNGKIQNSYSSISTTHPYAGLVAEASGSAICTRSYWDENSNKTEKSVMCEDGHRTTYDMQNPDRLRTYVGWSDTNWDFQVGQYPLLKNMPPQ